MSFYTDKKSEHEVAAVRALENKKYVEAHFHVLKAAEMGFSLAEHSSGLVAQAYINDANDLLDLSRQIKEHFPVSPKQKSDDDDDNKDENEPKDDKVNRWRMTEKPDIRLKDVAGLDEVKRVIQEDLLDAVQFEDAYRKLKIPSGGGALMYGPPGNGKTFMAKAIAGELDAAFFTVSGADMKDKYVGETEKNMRLLFEAAAEYDRAVVFIDEIQAILSRRGREKVSAVDQFLVMTDGVKERKNMLLILGATNYPWMLDDAVFRRLGKLIYVGMPDAPARKKIFQLQFDGVPTAPDFPYDEFALLSDRFSGADIARICADAKKKSVQRMKSDSADAPLVRKEDVLEAIDQTKPTVNPDLLQQYKDWENSFFNGGVFKKTDED